MGKKTTEVEAAPSRGRKIIITDIKSGKEFARVDVIKELWDDGNGMKRGEIVKVLKEKYDHEVAYQIVFAATKTPKTAETTDAKEKAA